MSILTYKYYDTPEGQDIFKKVFVTSKYAAITGLSASTFDVLMFSHPQGIANTLGRVMWITGPLIGMASAFTVTTNVAQGIRGKNDMFNYFLGGIASGAIFGAWQRSVTVSIPAGLFLGAIAVVKKTAIDEGWVLMPQGAQSTENANSVRHDWTMVQDIEHLKTWTRGAQ